LKRQLILPDKISTNAYRFRCADRFRLVRQSGESLQGLFWPVC